MSGPPSVGRDSSAEGDRLVRPVAIGSGLLLIALGVLGLIGGPIAGRPGAAPLVVTGPGHDIAHLVLGALFIHVAFALSGRMAADGLAILGVVSLVFALLTFLSADLVGWLGAPSNVGDQVLHLAIGVVALVVGRLARSGRGIAMPRRGRDEHDL